MRVLKLMKLLIKYLKAGKIDKNKIQNSFIIRILVLKFSDLSYKIILFFDKFSILSVKNLDYLDWRKISNKIN